MGVLAAWQEGPCQGLSRALSSASCASPETGRIPSQVNVRHLQTVPVKLSQMGRMGLTLPTAVPQRRAPGSRPGGSEARGCGVDGQPRGPRASLPSPRPPEQGGSGLSSHCGLSQSQRIRPGVQEARFCLNSKTKAVATMNQFPRFSTGDPRLVRHQSPVGHSGAVLRWWGGWPAAPP